MLIKIVKLILREKTSKEGFTSAVEFNRLIKKKFFYSGSEPKIFKSNKAYWRNLYLTSDSVDFMLSKTREKLENLSEDYFSS